MVKEGKRIKAKNLQRLAPTIYNQCIKSSKHRWFENLYKILFKEKGLCLQCKKEVKIRTFKYGFDPCCSNTCYSHFVTENGYYPVRNSIIEMPKIYPNILSIKELKSSLDECKDWRHVHIARISPNIYRHVMKLANKYNSLWQDELYRLLYPNEGYCICGTRLIRIWNKLDMTRKFCSWGCSNKDINKLNKTKTTCLRKYGLSSTLQLSKSRKTMVKRYGVEYTGQSNKLKLKMKTTNLELYGSENPFGSTIIKAKIKRAMLEKYGVENSLQIRSIHEKQQKSGFKHRKFTIQGKTFSLRGYEPMAVKFMVKELGIKARDILTTAKEEIPSIPWIDSKGKSHIYHPDAFVKKGNQWYLVEVKSEYTAGFTVPKSGLFSVMKRKIQACVDARYNVKLLVVLPKYGTHVVHNVHLKTRKQVMSEIYELG